MTGKLRMMRAVADDLGNPDFVVIARTDGLSAVDAPQPERGLALAIDRGLRYLDTGIPDLLWCEFPTADREPVETFTTEIRKRFPDARFAFNYSSSFKWFNDPDPLTFAELGSLGVRFIFITLGAQHANGLALSNLLSALAEGQEQGYIDLQRREWDPAHDIPTRSHHQFSGVPYHHLVGTAYDAARLGSGVRGGPARRQGGLSARSGHRGITPGGASARRAQPPPRPARPPRRPCRPPGIGTTARAGGPRRSTSPDASAMGAATELMPSSNSSQTHE